MKFWPFMGGMRQLRMLRDGTRYHVIARAKHKYDF
jgi:hypothetical protein